MLPLYGILDPDKNKGVRLWDIDRTGLPTARLPSMVQVRRGSEPEEATTP